MDIESALWILLVWCFSTRASVATVRRMHPCASNFSWVKYLTHKINWFALTMAPRIPWSSHQTDDTKRGNITICWKVSMRIHLITSSPSCAIIGPLMTTSMAWVCTMVSELWYPLAQMSFLVWLHQFTASFWVWIKAGMGLQQMNVYEIMVCELNSIWIKWNPGWSHLFLFDQ